MSTKRRLVELRIPSIFGYEKIAMATVAAVAARLGIAGERANDLRTAVAEACINAIEYGNGSAAEVPVVVTMSVDEQHLIVDVRDRALGTTKPHMGKMVDLQNPPTGPHGNMGLFLIQHLVDEVDIVCRANSTHIHMAMRLPELRLH
ncbi:MAG TPA: ATP-binding protein [Chloroflexia bacterium]|nr:ATP-binding protein [Chloroflexia bacterium]